MIPTNFQMVYDDVIKMELKQSDPAAFALINDYVTLGLIVSFGVGRNWKI
jgi:hypothetical protein